MTPSRQATAARRTRLSVRQQSSITPTRSRSGRILQQSKSRKNKQRQTDCNEDLEPPTENVASPIIRSSRRTRSQAKVAPRTRAGRSTNHQQSPDQHEGENPSDASDADRQVDDASDDDHPVDEGDEDHPGDNNDHLQVTTPDMNMDDQIREAIDDLLEVQNPPAASNSINYSEHYVVLSDDESDLVYIPSDDEDDVRITEAVRILEGNLSLNAPSSPEASPSNTINDTIDSIEASPRATNPVNDTIDSIEASPRATNPVNDTIDLTESPKPPSFTTVEDSPGPSSPSSPGLSLVRIKCPICFDSLVQIKSSGKRLMSTICGHIFCSSCLPACIKTTKNCPSCRKTLKIKDIHPIFF